MDDNSKVEYKITDSDEKKNTVTYVKSHDASANTLLIPESVVMAGKTYKVTNIANNAFRDNKKLTKVTIGSNIITIGDGAFRGCTNLKTVVMGENVKVIGKSAFYGCKKLKTITIKTKKLTAKKVGAKAFKGIKSKATVKVPKKKYKAYKTMLRKKGVGKKARYKKI